MWSQTTKNHYFVASEYGHEAAGGGEWTAQRFRRAIQWPVIFGPNERNKIKILLRSELVCAIIWVFKLLARLINQQTAESRLVKACFDVSYIRNSHYRFGGTKYEALFRLPIDSS